MEINTREQNGTLIVAVIGHVNQNSQVEFEKVLVQLAMEHSRIVLDLTGLISVNATFLRVLLRILVNTQDEDGDLVMFELQPKVMRVIKLVGFNQIVKIYPDENAALAHFSKC